MLGDKIKKMRENQSLTQIQLADKVNADISTISKIENNKSNPSLPMLYRIARVLDCTPDELIKDTEIKSLTGTQKGGRVMNTNAKVDAAAPEEQVQEQTNVLKLRILLNYK